MALFAVTSGLIAILLKRLPPASAMILGGSITAMGLALLVLSTYQRSLPIFLAALTAAGAGYSLIFLGGLNLINANAPIHHRGGTLSAIFFIAYLMQGVIAMLLGAAATAWGLKVAIDFGSSFIALLSFASIALALSSRSSPELTIKICPLPSSGQQVD